MDVGVHVIQLTAFAMTGNNERTPRCLGVKICQESLALSRANADSFPAERKHGTQVAAENEIRRDRRR